MLDVYDTSDEDWTLVAYKGEYGFAPANYIEIAENAQEAAPPTPVRSRPPVSAPEPEPEPEPEEEERGLPTPTSPTSSIHSPAAALAGILAHKTGSAATTNGTRSVSSPPLPARPAQFTPEESDDEAPAPRLPQRPPSQSLSPPTTSTQYATARDSEPPGVLPSPPYNRGTSRTHTDDDHRNGERRGYHIYNIFEMVEVMGRNKKMPVTLGINPARGVIMISPENSKESKEWTAEKLTHYSIEGKHVFMELVRPSKSIDFHAGAKDTAQEIVAMLGDVAGAMRAEGLREVLSASSGHRQKKGKMLYDFMAQGDDEVTVAAEDEVIVLDDARSEEWWMVRRLKNGKEGVVPSNYVEITGTIDLPPSMSGLNAGKSFVEQNRLEEERLAKHASRSSKHQDQVGPGMQLPQRGSSLMRDGDRRRDSQKAKRESRDGKQDKKSSKPSLKRRFSSWIHNRQPSKETPPLQEAPEELQEPVEPEEPEDSEDPCDEENAFRLATNTITVPDPQKIRTWTDRSGSFKVEAEFLGLREGKIHLHKMNGVKIAVPVVKMSIEDLEYVEWATGVSLDEDKPLSDIKRSRTRGKEQRKEPAPQSNSGASVQPKKPEYDWFDFFLQAGCDPQICQRYANAFDRDNIGEESMPDINPQLLRTLGLKEGDILRVTKLLDKKYNRQRNVSFADGAGAAEGQSPSEDVSSANGSLFSGPGGALRNNTRRGRPAPAQVTKDEVDPKAFEQKTEAEKKPPADSTPTPLTSAPAPKKQDLISGFDDDAWAPRDSKTQPATTPATSAPAQALPTATAAPVPAAPTGAAAELSLLSPPLQPTPTAQPAPQQPAQPQAPVQPQGATPGLFEQLAKAPPQPQPQQQQQYISPQQTGYGLNPQLNVPRQRPVAPQQTGVGSLIAPPPQRAASAPHSNQQSGFGPPPPLQPQLTGYQQSQLHVQPALPGQSLNDIQRQQQFQAQQQQYAQLQAQQTGFPGFNPQQQQPNGLMPQPTGFPSQFPQQQQVPNIPGFPGGFQQPQPTGFQQPAFNPQLYQQQLLAGQQAGSPFADPPIRPFQPQATGFAQSLAPQRTGVNAFLPPALQPQPTGAPQNQFQPGGTFSPPPVPPIPQSQQSVQPLVPQKTGPPPPVRFGVSGAKKLAPQPTGRRANLAAASEFAPEDGEEDLIEL